MIDGGGVRAFGAAAKRYALLLGNLPVFVVSGELEEAWEAMLAQRRAGTDCAFMPLVDDARTVMSQAAALDVCRQVSDYDGRRFYFDAIERGDLDLGAGTLLQQSRHDPKVVERFRDLFRLGSALVVRSFAELYRLQTLFGTVRCPVTRWFPVRTLSQAPASARSGVVIWAPEDAADRHAVEMFAMEQFHSDVTIVAESPPSIPTRCAYAHPSSADAQRRLAEAACAIDTTPGDAGWAHAFTQAGIPVVCTSTSGAVETLEGIGTYEPWSFLSVARAVQAALGRGPGYVREPAPPARGIMETLERIQIATPARAPLVSIVIPTYNRRAMLEQTLGELIKQQYRNIEILVVNDGGERVSDLATIDPRIRAIERDVNVGTIRAANFGLREARGEYALGVADDDRLYPDHVLRLVAALERTGAAVAHTNVLLCAVLPNGIVYDTERFSETLDLCETYAYHRVVHFMTRRSILLELGGFAEDLFAADLEMLIRLGERYDFVHVPAITAETWLRGADQVSTRAGLDHRRILQEMFERHPAPGRPYIAALRKKTLDLLSKRRDQNSSSIDEIGDSSSSGSSVNSSSSSSSV